MWVLASDDVERLRSLVSAFAVLGGVRERWAAQRIAVVVAEGGKVEHVSKSVNGTDKDSVRRLWHDWFLMSVRYSPLNCQHCLVFARFNGFRGFHNKDIGSRAIISTSLACAIGFISVANTVFFCHVIHTGGAQLRAHS